MLTGVITDFFDMRISSPLLQRLRKHGTLRGYCFCVDIKNRHGLARQGLSVTG